MSLTKWFHHLFNPHCPDCVEADRCESCEVFRQLLESERHEKNKLIDQIIELTKPEQVIEVKKSVDDKIPINANMTWKVRRQILEQEDRTRAKVLAEQKLNQIKPLTTEELEEQLGISDSDRENNAQRISEETS